MGPIKEKSVHLTQSKPKNLSKHFIFHLMCFEFPWHSFQVVIITHHHSAQFNIIWHNAALLSNFENTSYFFLKHSVCSRIIRHVSIWYNIFHQSVLSHITDYRVYMFYCHLQTPAQQFLFKQLQMPYAYTIFFLYPLMHLKRLLRCSFTNVEL